MSDKPPEKMTVEELLTAIGYRVADLRFEANLHSKTALVTADADDPQPGDGRTWDIVWEVDYERKVYGRAVNRNSRTRSVSAVGRSTAIWRRSMRSPPS